MLKQKLKLQNSYAIKPSLVSLQLSPWDKNQLKNQSNNLDQIPTYRRQIVQKFMINIHSKNKNLQNSKINFQEWSSSKVKQQYQMNLNAKEQKKRNKTCTSDTTNIRNMLNMKKEQIFKQRYSNAYKSRMKTAVINLDMDFDNQISMSKFNQNLQQNGKIFTRKMRLKQEIACKKNIERVKKKCSTIDVVNNVKNIVYGNQFTQAPVSTQKSFYPKTLVRHQNFIFKSRPVSQSATRSKTINFW